jgi:hypothetical protein
MEQMTEPIPLVCALTGPELAARREQVVRVLFSAVSEVRELPDGYALAFPGGAEWLTQLAEFIAFERACCPFFTFELRCEPQRGPIWLTVHGPEGTKEMFQAELPLAELPPVLPLIN